MPPRYAYWTILIDSKPTAFRAREKEELLPTFRQLRRTNKDVVMKWFARGRLWESRDEERNWWQRRKTPAGVTPERRGAKASASWVPRDQEKEKRGGDWRPGGQHKDPRNRFKKRARLRDDRQKPAGVAQVLRPAHKSRESRPWTNKPKGAPGGPRPWRDKPSGGAPLPSPQSAQTVKKPEAPGLGPRRPEGCGAPRASEK